MSCLIDAQKPPPRGEVNTRDNQTVTMTQHSSKNWSQGYGNKLTLELKMNYTIKRMLVRTLTTNFKITVKSDCAISPHTFLPQPIKLWPMDCHWRGAGLWTVSTCPQPVASIQNKANFLAFIKLASLLASEWQAARPSFWLR